MRKRFLPNQNFDDPSDDSLINLTPLIDVVFVVLITFILIAPILKMDKIELAPGASQGKESSLPVQSRTTITIRVFDNDKISINNRSISENELYSVLLSLKKSYPAETPMLFQDKKATFGAYQMVKNAVESAGFEQLDVILKP